MGSALSICSYESEALFFSKFPFERIVVTGINQPNETIKKHIAEDSRLSYKIENAECLTYDDRSFDLVFCKEGLHHLARPILGLYEMLRVCKRAVIVIEPHDTWVGRILEKLHLSTIYERGEYEQKANIENRDNYVFRFNRTTLESILKSYYLDSGFFLDMYLGWLTTRFGLYDRSPKFTKTLTLLSIVANLIPGAHGNYVTAIIRPGTKIPPPIEACESV